MTNKFDNLFQQAINYLNRGEIDKSEKICFELLNITNDSEIYNLLAIINNTKGNIYQAIDYMITAININPYNHLYCFNIAEFYRKINQLSNAIDYINKSIKLKPDFSAAYLVLGSIYSATNNLELAKNAFNNALKVNHNEYKAYQALGNIFYNEGLINEAIHYYISYLKYNPKDESINYLVGICFGLLDNFLQVEYYYKTAESINKENIYVIKALHLLLSTQFRFFEAKYYLDKYLTLINKQSNNNLATEIYKEISLEDFDYNNKTIEKYRETIKNSINKFLKLNIESFDLNSFYHENSFVPNRITYQGFDNKTLKSDFADIFYKLVPNQDKKFNIGKIKIGFIVTNKHESIFYKFMEYIISKLDRNEFDIYIISDSRFKNSLYYRNLNTFTFIKLDNDLIKNSKIISDLNLDIVYHWEIGTDSLNYFLPFFKTAPIQCTSIGWPETSGNKNIDYFISSKLIEIENAQDHYTEQLYMFDKLPLYCEKPIRTEFKDIEYFGLKKGINIYFCGQNLRKVSPDFDNIISEILRKDLNGIIIFIDPDNNSRIAELLYTRIKLSNPDIIDRIKFLKKMSNQDYLNLLTYSSVVLDTLYYGSANSAYDAFAMEVPIVTLPFSHERGRYVLGCYKQMGIKGLVAKNSQEYIDLAVKTAKDIGFRNEIINYIKNNNYLLFNDYSLVEEYSNFFKRVARKSNN